MLPSANNWSLGICHSDGPLKDRGSGEAPGAQCQVCNRQGPREGPLSPYTVSGQAGGKQGGEGRPYSVGEMHRSNRRENPESDKPGQQEGDTEKAKAAKRSLKTENGSELSVKR